MCVYVYVSMCVCPSVYLSMCLCVYVSLCMCPFVCISQCVCVPVYVPLRVYPCVFGVWDRTKGFKHVIHVLHR